MTDESIFSCVFSSAIACGLALLPFELVEFPGILLVLCFVLQCLPAPFALGFLLCLFSFPPVFSCALKLLRFFSSFFFSSVVSTLPPFSIFNIQSPSNEQEKLLCSLFILYTSSLQRSIPLPQVDLYLCHEHSKELLLSFTEVVCWMI